MPQNVMMMLKLESWDPNGPPTIIQRSQQVHTILQTVSVLGSAFGQVLTLGEVIIHEIIGSHAMPSKYARPQSAGFSCAGTCRPEICFLAVADKFKTISQAS